MVWKKRHESCLKELPASARGWKRWQEEAGGSLLVQNNTYDGQQTPPQPLGHFSSFLGGREVFLGTAVCLEVMLLLFLLSSVLQLALSVLVVP